MATAVLPYGGKLSSGSGSTACWLPVATTIMAKANPSPTAKAEKIQQKIAQLEAKKLLMQSKADRLLDGVSQTTQAITALQRELAAFADQSRL